MKIHVEGENMKKQFLFIQTIPQNTEQNDIAFDGCKTLFFMIIFSARCHDTLRGFSISLLVSLVCSKDDRVREYSGKRGENWNKTKGKNIHFQLGKSAWEHRQCAGAVENDSQNHAIEEHSYREERNVDRARTLPIVSSVYHVYAIIQSLSYCFRYIDCPCSFWSIGFRVRAGVCTMTVNLMLLNGKKEAEKKGFLISLQLLLRWWTFQLVVESTFMPSHYSDSRVLTL